MNIFTKKHFLSVTALTLSAGLFTQTAFAHNPIESINLYEDTFIYLPDQITEVPLEEVPDKSKYQFNYGIKARFTGFDLRYFNSSSKVSGMDAPQKTHREIFTKDRYSFCGDLSRLSDYPIEAGFLWGSLTFTGSFSRMNNPSMSMLSSPFTHLPSLSSHMTVSLPSKTSSVKPDAFAFYFVLPADDPFSRKAKLSRIDSKGFISEPVRIEASYSEDNSKGSVLAGFRYRNFLRFSQSVSVMSFTLNPKKDTSWYGTWPNYSESRLSSILLDSYLSIPFIKTKLSACFTETPFENLRTWLRTENLISWGSFSLLSVLYLRDDFCSSQKMNLICPDASVEPYFFQVKLTPEISIFLKNNCIFSFGIGGTYGEKLEEQGLKATCLKKASFSSGTKFVSSKGNVRFTCSINDITVQKLPESSKEEPLPYYSIDAGFTRHFGKKLKYCLQLTGNTKIRPDRKEEKNKYEETLRLSLYRKNSVLNSMSFSAAASQQGKKNRLSFTAKTGITLPIGAVNFQGTVGVTEALEL